VQTLDLTFQLTEIAEAAQSTFGNLALEQINWKANPKSWSIGQCFEHLIKINSEYFPYFESIIKGERKQTFWENYSPLSRFFGNLLFVNLSPQAERKLKAPKTATPSSSDISPTIIEDFAKHQTALIGKIKQTENLDTKKIIITSPFMKAITYSLFDAYRIIMTHEKRHFQQAERVTQNESFPK
jgi:DinB superfamily